MLYYDKIMKVKYGEKKKAYVYSMLSEDILWQETNSAKKTLTFYMK